MGPSLKTSFKKTRSIAPLYTSGPVAVTTDGQRIITCIGDQILLTEIASGTEICRFQSDSEDITSLSVTPSSSHLLAFTAANALRVFELPGSNVPINAPIRPIRIIARAHDAPVHVCTTDPTSTYLASGSADGVVKVWDIVKGYITHIFKGHGGIVSALVFSFPHDPSSVLTTPAMKLFTASVDTRIRMFDLSSTMTKGAGGLKPEAVLEGHVSVPRSLDVSDDGKWLISGGRDSVVLVWDLQPASQTDIKGKGKAKQTRPQLVRTVPALERVEAAGLIKTSEGALTFFTGGDKGMVKVWDGRTGKVLYTLGSEGRPVTQDDDEEQRQIVDVIFNADTSSLISVHADQNIMFYSLATQQLTRHLIGFNDEIVDASFLSSPTSTDSHVAFATNSSLIRVYSVSTADARLLAGHSDIVLCLDTSAGGRILASGGKDHTARIWSMKDSLGDWGLACSGICEGHTESIGALALSRQHHTGDSFSGFVFTGSQDRTIKMWELVDIPFTHSVGTPPKQFKSLCTQKAHDKDINTLDVAQNDKLLASGSQDRSAKVFEIVYTTGKSGSRGELKLLGTCKGHKRGVWSVKFSKAERLLATGSGDKTVKLWNLEDFSCVKTFEGHTNSVLRVEFLTNGLQLVSSASDGLVKVWNVQSEECTTTLDNHEDKVWALAVSQDETTVVTGAADSIVTFWEDSTTEEQIEKETKRAELVLKEQDFVNYVALNQFQQAIQLALDMQQPGRLLNLFKTIAASEEAKSGLSLTGNAAVDEVIRTLPGPELVKLLRYVKEWNANAKTSPVAQVVLYAIMKLRDAGMVMKAFGEEVLDSQLSRGFVPGVKGEQLSGSTALKELVEALIPYTERHLARMNRLLQESYMVDYILSEMDDGMVQLEDDESMDVSLI
ncbi:U3 small nucleolar RNA-associated protein [Flagelloscypha sp. PMI_526]|nr:U3 small nucleolar RNA-associated protein [Flagelloscypha sp. PMI_526]